MTASRHFEMAKISYIPIASTVLSAALIALAIGFSAPTGEQSKLAYEGNLWCVSNYIEKEPRVYLKDGRPQMDDRLKGKEDWIIRDQVAADSKEEAEAKAQKNGGGMFEPSDKTTLRDTLDKNDKKFFTTHFNQGATIAGPCLGGASSTSFPGRWLNDAIREDCFGLSSGTQNTPSGGPIDANTTCGKTLGSLVGSAKMLDANSKLGHEDHLSQTNPTHYQGKESAPLTVIGGGAFAPHTTDQEHWYFNAQWGGWDWSPSATRGQGPRIIRSTEAAKIRQAIPHKKLIIKSVETGKSVVVSAEESGPAKWVTNIHGVNFGAPPEVYNYLGTSDPYTKNPNDNKGRVTVLGFAQDQSIPLGPCK